MGINIISLGRGYGKTKALLHKAHNNEKLIIVTNNESSRQHLLKMAEDLKLDIVYPITFLELNKFKEEQYGRSLIPELLFDNVDDYIEMITGAKLNTITLTPDK